MTTTTGTPLNPLMQQNYVDTLTSIEHSLRFIANYLHLVKSSDDDDPRITQGLCDSINMSILALSAVIDDETVKTYRL